MRFTFNSFEPDLGEHEDGYYVCKFVYRRHYEILTHLSKSYDFWNIRFDSIIDDYSKHERDVRKNCLDLV